MKSLLAIFHTSLVFSVVGCSPTAQVVPCHAFRTGTFVFRPQGGKAPWSYTIIRTDSLQTELEQPTGGKSTLAITWLNDCTYQLRLVSSTIPYPDSIQRLRKTVPLTTEILQATDRYYVFRSQRTSTDAAFVDTLWRQ